ncbi:hypothetical protein IKE83_00615 [Candidatus Saccharibacteria bacterium]|nr:hypothetical protein [Candidatus Saccharibacteria bacterium]
MNSNDNNVTTTENETAMSGDVTMGEGEMVAKSTTKQAGPLAQSTDGSSSSDTTGSGTEMAPDATSGEMPAGMGQGGPIMGGFNGGGFQATTAATTGNEWLIPMTATGIISGVIAIAAVAICLTIWFSGKKK